MVIDSAAVAPLALSVEERRLVRDIIDAVIPDAEVSVFGSRSTGRARPYSDLDLLFTRPARLTLAQRAELRKQVRAAAGKCTSLDRLQQALEILDEDNAFTFEDSEENES